MAAHGSGMGAASRRLAAAAEAATSGDTGGATAQRSEFVDAVTALIHLGGHTASTLMLLHDRGEAVQLTNREMGGVLEWTLAAL